jgi:hypothetical protein
MKMQIYNIHYTLTIDTITITILKYNIKWHNDNEYNNNALAMNQALIARMLAQVLGCPGAAHGGGLYSKGYFQW